MNILPDPERRHLLQFYVAPQMGYGTRLSVAGVLIAAAVVTQLAWPGQSAASALFFTLPLLLVGNLFLLVRGYDLQPAGVHSHKTEWEKTTRDRFASVRKLEDQVKTWDETFADITCVTGVFCLFLTAGAEAPVAFLIDSVLGNREFWTLVFVADAAVLILPPWLTGTRHGWRPAALRQQIRSLETAMAVLDRFEEPPCQIQPMFEMTGKGDKRTPKNARVFVRFPDGPEDLLGLQFQVAINNVQGTKYPYLYAVIVAKNSFHLLENHGDQVRSFASGRPATESSGWKRLLGLEDAGKLVVETSVEDDVDVIVLRQKTTKNSGYHTDSTAVRRIATTAWHAVAQLLV